MWVNQSRRFEELDSLRGIAAIIVMFLHMYEIIPENKFIKILFEYGPLRLFISGGESVILFFVLSGFVLSLPFYNKSNFGYIPFIIKRICRIYIPYLVSIIAVLGCREMFYTGKTPNLSGWFNSFWTNTANASVLREHLILVDSFLSNLNPVVWSLVHEMRISLVFPFVMYFLIKLNWKKVIILSLLFSLVSVISFYLFKPSDTGTELSATINYIAMFIMGAFIAKYRGEIQKKYLSISKRSKILLFLSGLFMYLYVHPSFVLKIIFSNIAPFYRTVIDSWTVSLGSVIIIVFSMCSVKLSRILQVSFISFLGKISYSLYLIHLIVLFSFVRVFFNVLPIWIIYFSSLIVSLIISSLMYYIIEKPSIKVGKYLSKQFLILGKNMTSKGVSA